jgi:hypothetical protein
MRDQKEYIIGYVDYLASQFQSQLEQLDTRSEDIQKYIHWISLLDNLKTKFQWQFLSLEEKQLQRVAWLRSLQKRGLDIEKQLLTLELYDGIMTALPYMKSYKTLTQVDRMINVCEKELLIIDYSGRGFGTSHISIEDYRSAFNVNLESLAVPAYILRKMKNISALFQALIKD